jgi:hypothetical protein
MELKYNLKLEENNKIIKDLQSKLEEHIMLFKKKSD